MPEKPRPLAPPKPAERLKEWMNQRGFTHKDIADEPEIRYSKSAIDSFCARRRLITQDFAERVAALDARKIKETGGDPDTAIRWQYLVGKDDYPTVQYGLAVCSLIDAMEDARQKEIKRDTSFLQYGYQCQRVRGGFLITPEGGTPRHISLKEMDRILEDIKTFAQVRIERAYKDGKEAVDDVNAETDTR